MITIFAVSLLIIALLLTYTMNANMHNTVIILFVISLLCLAIELLFIQDMGLSLKVLKENVKGCI